jgi:N-acetylglucosamine kinase-like BadF-type ATPase
MTDGVVTHFVAVDGGNSKTDVVVGANDGRILALVRGPGSSPHNLGVEGSIAMLDGLIREALGAAGVRADLLVACLAGIDLPIEAARFAKAVNDAGWATDNVVDNDLFALLRAGTPDPNAIAVICGAGINCVGRRADGRTARFPALGPISGDWGGGGYLAHVALWHAARGEDGRGPTTALSPAVAQHFGRARVEDVAAAIHLGEIPASRVSELTPLLFDVAESGDDVARRVVLRQAREIVTLARVASERLELLDRAHTVVLGGGLVAARRPPLHEPLMRGLAAIAPHATIKIVQDQPITGAALLALDRLGAVTPEIEATVRSAVADRIAVGRT